MILHRSPAYSRSVLYRVLGAFYIEKILLQYRLNHKMKLETRRGSTFPIRMYGKVELAQYYFPGVHPALARDHLSRWIRKNPELRKELEELSIGTRVPYYTSQQVEVILRHLGDP
jgi:hypothetical protein